MEPGIWKQYKKELIVQNGEEMNHKKSKKWFVIICILLVTLFFAACAGNKQDTWIPLFNGKNLDGWHVKITGYDLDDNFGNTFRVGPRI